MASTSIVPSRLRGKLGGLYGTAESFGRFTSAIGFAVLFAWSISSEKFVWVDHRFVFYASALVLGVATVVAWRTLPADIFSEKSAVRHTERVDGQARLATKTKTACECNIPGSRPTGEMDLI